MNIKQPVKLVAAPLEPPMSATGRAADGFPIDPILQQRARRATIGYSVLALYYLTVMPFVLKFVRWGSFVQVAEDLLERAEILTQLTGYIAANVLLAVCAWHIISMSRWTSLTVAGLSLCFTGWTCGTLGLSVWRMFANQSATVDIIHVAIPVCLFLGYVASSTILLRAVLNFNAQRDTALVQAQGRNKA